MVVLRDNQPTPASGQIIGIAGSENSEISLRTTLIVPTDLTTVGDFITAGAQTVNVFLDLTMGSLTSYDLVPFWLSENSTAFTMMQIRVWDDSEASFDIQSPAPNTNMRLRFNASGTWLLCIPTFGAPRMRISHEGNGDNTSSDAVISVARGWSFHTTFNMSTVANQA